MQPNESDPVLRWVARRTAINRANSPHSTGPRTAAGKQRSSRNALRHGLTARSPVLPSEDQAAYQQHCRRFHDEYQPTNATESQLVQELADTAWRLNRIPLLESNLLAQPDSLPPQDLCRALETLAVLGLHSSRLSRQFQKTLDTLRAIQDERRLHERRRLRDAAELLELHKHKGIPWQPSEDGFVFSKEQVERHAQLLMRQNEAGHFAYPLFNMPAYMRTSTPEAAAAS